MNTKVHSGFAILLVGFAAIFCSVVIWIVNGLYEQELMASTLSFTPASIKSTALLNHAPATAAETKNTVPADWKKYRNELAEVEIRAPKDWVIKNIDKGDQGSFLSAALFDPKQDPSTTTPAINFDYYSELKSIPAAKTSDSMEQYIGKKFDSKAKPFNMNGEQGWLVADKDTTTIYTQHNDNIYRIAFHDGAVTSPDALTETQKQFLEGLRFIQ